MTGEVQKVDQLWDVVVGDLDNAGMVRTLERHGELLERLTEIVFGDNNGQGLKSRVFDLEKDRRTVIWWARAIGGITTSQLIALGWYIFTNGAAG